MFSHSFTPYPTLSLCIPSSSLGLDDFAALALAKAGRAAKAGARAGRLVRLVRLVKIFKFAKWILGRAMRKRQAEDEKEDELENNLHFNMSILGRRMTESITKKVIIAVVLMLIMFSATETDFTPDARQIQLNSIAEYPDSSDLLDSFFHSHDNIIDFNGAGYNFTDQERIDDLREVEVLALVAESNASISASFDISDETVTQSWYSLLITSIVSILLATMGLLFSRDAYKMVIHPIEKMKSTVQQLSENPLLHLERIKNRDNSAHNETDMLEQAITKMGKFKWRAFFVSFLRIIVCAQELTPPFALNHFKLLCSKLVSDQRGPRSLART